jgi:glycosyltransferase involved in cell wall biosynthesis
MISTVIVDSRSNIHPQWVEMAIQSVKAQIFQTELIVIDNRKNEMSIGKAFNEGVKKAKGDWVLFLGDDDFLSDDYTAILAYHIRKFKAGGISPTAISTYMTAFDNNDNYGVIDRPATGMWRKNYLEDHNFDEELKASVDRDLQENLLKEGGIYAVVPYHFGYFYRQHDTKTCDEIQFMDKRERVKKWHYPKLH